MIEFLFLFFFPSFRLLVSLRRQKQKRLEPFFQLEFPFSGRLDVMVYCPKPSELFDIRALKRKWVSTECEEVRIQLQQVTSERKNNISKKKERKKRNGMNSFGLG